MSADEAVVTPDGDTWTLLADDRVLGTITSNEARMCADWLREHFDVPKLVEFFDAIAGDS